MTKHGHRRTFTPTYNSWRAMLERCRYPRHPFYADYGGRGIVVCERWHQFAAFLADMGERPPGRTLDRVDVDGPYEPGNCRWSTPLQQRWNRRDMAARQAESACHLYDELAAKSTVFAGTSEAAPF